MAKTSGAVVSFDLNFRQKLWKLSGGEERAREVIGRILSHVFVEMIKNVVARYPHIKIVATTLREVHSTTRHAWGAVAWINGEVYLSPKLELDVHDRVGGGDGFASGFFYGILNGESPEQAVKLGWAHGALLTTFPGDTTMATLDQVRSLAQGGTARIQR